MCVRDLTLKRMGLDARVRLRTGATRTTYDLWSSSARPGSRDPMLFESTWPRATPSRPPSQPSGAAECGSSRGPRLYGKDSADDEVLIGGALRGKATSGELNMIGLKRTTLFASARSRCWRWSPRALAAAAPARVRARVEERPRTSGACSSERQDPEQRDRLLCRRRRSCSASRTLPGQTGLGSDSSGGFGCKRAIAFAVSGNGQARWQ